MAHVLTLLETRWTNTQKHTQEKDLMRTITQQKKQAGWLVILTGCLLLFTASFVAAQDSTSEMSVEETLFTQGSVRKVSTEKNTISVKVSKEEKIQILVTPLTDFVGMKSLTELKKGKRVKVWYTLAGEENRAVKVELLIDVGC